MSKLSRELYDNFSGSFEKNSNEFRNLKLGIDLFLNIVEFETGNIKLDGISNIISNALTDIYVNRTLTIAPVKLLADSIEPYFKKIILLKDGTDFTDVSMDLVSLMKVLDLNRKLSNPSINPALTIEKLNSYKNEPEYLYHLCKIHIIRNEVHNSPKWNMTELLENTQSLLIIYLYTTIKYRTVLSPFVSRHLDETIKASKYLHHINSVLTSNHSLKLLQTDFGDSSVQNLEDFEIKIRAKQKEKKKERDEYLKDKHSTKIIPLKLLPDFEIITSSNKYYLLHGIATSGKTTILKNIGKYLLSKDKYAYVFYLELGKCYECSIKKSLLDEIKNQYKQITDLDFNIENSKRKTLILLDGLDEVANSEVKEFIISEISSLMKYPKIQIILTSRTNDYINNNLAVESIFEKFELLPLNPAEMISIAEKIIDNGHKLDSFIKFIKQSEIIKAFPKTPLTTILFAIIFKEQDIDIKELPKNITELYKKIIDIFLVRWDKSRGISEQFKIQQKELVLQKIAIQLHTNRQIAISAEDLEKFIIELSEKKPINGTSDPKEFIRNLVERTSIFIKNDYDNTYQFFHLTLQEYLASTKFTYKDDDNLVANFYDEWWLNPNIFYAGRDPEYSDILQRIANFEIFPANIESKINYIIHSSKVLLAAHSLDNSVRNHVLKSMIKVFDDFLKEFITEISVIEKFSNKIENRVYNKTMLDIVLFARDFFMEFFSSKDFVNELKKIWNEYIIENPNLEYTDITLYCMSYCLSLREKNANYLEEFVVSDKFKIDVRWYKIIDVDITIKNLEYTDKKIKSKIKSKAHKHNDYIQKQFNERIIKHYKSITGFK